VLQLGHWGWSWGQSLLDKSLGQCHRGLVEPRPTGLLARRNDLRNGDKWKRHIANAAMARHAAANILPTPHDRRHRPQSPAAFQPPQFFQILLDGKRFWGPRRKS